MKYFITFCIAITALATSAMDVLAQSPYGQPPDPQEMLNQNPYMQDMQAFQARYDSIKKERELERKAVVDKIYAEELAKAKKEQATQGSFYDPHAASEWSAKQRIDQLSVQWKKEDHELEAKMQEDMLNNTSMGGMYKMHQEMMKQYGYPEPASR